jgi:hypothetical protein
VRRRERWREHPVCQQMTSREQASRSVTETGMSYSSQTPVRCDSGFSMAWLFFFCQASRKSEGSLRRMASPMCQVDSRAPVGAARTSGISSLQILERPFENAGSRGCSIDWHLAARETWSACGCGSDPGRETWSGSSRDGRLFLSRGPLSRVQGRKRGQPDRCGKGIRDAEQLDRDLTSQRNWRLALWCCAIIPNLRPMMGWGARREPLGRAVSGW